MPVKGRSGGLIGGKARADKLTCSLKYMVNQQEKTQQNVNIALRIVPDLKRKGY